MKLLQTLYFRYLCRVLFRKFKAKYDDYVAVMTSLFGVFSLSRASIPRMRTLTTRLSIGPKFQSGRELVVSTRTRGLTATRFLRRISFAGSGAVPGCLSPVVSCLFQRHYLSSVILLKSKVKCSLLTVPSSHETFKECN